MVKHHKRYIGMLRISLLIVTLLAVLLCQVVFCSMANAEDRDDRESLIEQQMKSEEIKKIGDEFNKHSMDGDTKKIIGEFNPENIIKDAAKGNFKLDVAGLFKKVLEYMFREIYTNIHVLVKLLVLIIICAILKNLQTSFLSEGVGELAFYVCYTVIVSVLVFSFNSALGFGIKAIDSMVGFMYATIPVLITLLVSGGNIITGGIFQPVLLMIAEVSATIFKNVFIPVTFLSAVLSIVNNISDRLQISMLADFLKQIVKWGIGIILTVFIALISVQGSLGAMVDGVAGKAAKFAIGTLIPVAGSYLADAADTVIGCSLLIKNAAGVVSMIGIAAICIVPLLKIAALITLFKLTALIAEPVSEKRITNCINDMAGSLTYIFGIAASVAFVFLISITAIIGASNLSAMVR